ncbi:zinc ribbon domain-containing protein [Paenibacillus sp. FSL W8-0426]|uniref:zinc ribbon domain-containing protein n=1 Tax=Paenibacillus sp. FSL W8-0426 TaxID=2921714 RepID=UPI0030DBC416
MNMTVCQSCGMPLGNAAQWGTEMDGKSTSEYCIYCYKEGRFEQPDISLDGMIEMCTAILVQEGMDEPSARSMLRHQLPFLKRWSASAQAGMTSAELKQEHNASPSAQPVTYVTLPAKRLAGVTARTSNGAEMSGKGSIQALWERYWSLPDLPAATTPRYGCYTDYADGVLGEYTILVGHELAPGDALPPHLEVIEIPPATYAVFATRTGPMAEVVSEAWGAVWAWNNRDERTFTGDFELYDERSLDPLNMQAELYIAVRPRS